VARRDAARRAASSRVKKPVVVLADRGTPTDKEDAKGAGVAVAETGDSILLAKGTAEYRDAPMIIPRAALDEDSS